MHKTPTPCRVFLTRGGFFRAVSRLWRGVVFCAASHLWRGAVFSCYVAFLAGWFFVLCRVFLTRGGGFLRRAGFFSWVRIYLEKRSATWYNIVGDQIRWHPCCDEGLIRTSTLSAMPRRGLSVRVRFWRCLEGVYPYEYAFGDASETGCDGEIDPDVIPKKQTRLRLYSRSL